MKALWVSFFLFGVAAPAPASERPQTFAQLDQPPVGVAASHDGRVFVCFSRAVDPKVAYSVAELKNGEPVIFPPGFQQKEGEPAPDRLLSVQALTVDAKDRLWILDSGRVGDKRVKPGAPQLIAYDLNQGRVIRRISFPKEIAGKNAFLNDVRIDLRRASEGVAYITDAAPKGPNAIVVVDLASGYAVRRLNGDPSTEPDKNLTLKVEGRPLEMENDLFHRPLRVGVDGLALSPDGEVLYYSPLTSHHLYSVRAEALYDLSQSGERVRETVRDLGDKGFASGGMLAAADGSLYVTDVENGAIRRRSSEGQWELIARDPALSWPDTLTMLPTGQVLVTASQQHRLARFRGVDDRMRPFQLLVIGRD